MSTKPANVPAALEPPPTQATTTSGSAPSRISRLCDQRLVAHHPLQLAHHVGERVRAHDRAQAVVGVLHRGHPFAHGLVHRVLQGAAARGDGPYLCPQQLHAEDIQLLALGVDLAHEHGALETEQRSGRGRRHAVLPGPGLGDDAGLAHAPGEQGLPHHVVQFVRAGVGQVLPLEQDPHAQLLREATALGHRGRATSVVVQQVVELPVERRDRPRPP